MKDPLDRRTTFGYDATGHQVYTENAEKRLTLAKTPTVVNTMTYRADGLRVEK